MVSCYTFLKRKGIYQPSIRNISQDVSELDWGSLNVLSLSKVFFCSFCIPSTLINLKKLRCRSYLRLFELIIAPMTNNIDACITLKNIILKVFVLNNSDREKELGCLWRREKLTKSKLELEQLFLDWYVTFPSDIVQHELRVTSCELRVTSYELKA